MSNKHRRKQKRASLQTVVAVAAIAYCSEAAASVLAKLQHDEIVGLVHGLIHAIVKLGTVALCLLL